MPKEEVKDKPKEKKSGRTIYVLLLSIIAVALLIIAFKPSSPTGNVVKGGSEINPFEVMNWKITPNYIDVQIKNNGKKDYNIDQITIAGCGTGEGGLISSLDYAGKTVHVICNQEIESTSFSNNAQVLYSSFGNGSATQTFTISGDVLKKKCAYIVKGIDAPFVKGECEIKWNCLDYIPNLTESLGVKSQDITIKGCDYSI
jgi:hypothetical protein